MSDPLEPRRRKDFRDLRLFRVAMDSSMEIYHLFRRFPEHEEQEELARDILNVSRTVCAKIAASWATRRTANVCLSNLKAAKAAAAETLVFIDMSHSLGYIDAEQRQRLFGVYERIMARLGKMVSKRLRQGLEDGEGYEYPED